MKVGCTFALTPLHATEAEARGLPTRPRPSLALWFNYAPLSGGHAELPHRASADSWAELERLRPPAASRCCKSGCGLTDALNN